MSGRRRASRSKTARKHAIDLDAEIARISNFVQGYVASSGAKGVVLGISGGVDSAVVAAVCAKSLGRKKVLGLYMFESGAEKSPDYEDARAVAKATGIKAEEVPISEITRSFETALRSPLRKKASRLTIANIKARVRMVLLYAFANQRDLLVAGTGDRSEELIGYFTKFGDGAADIMPIAHLYKTEVRALAARLRLPLRVVTKPSSPNLWSGHLARDELPADYEDIDRILALLYDEGLTPSETAKRSGLPLSLIRAIQTMNRKSEHKRKVPVSLQVTPHGNNKRDVAVKAEIKN